MEEVHPDPPQDREGQEQPERGAEQEQPPDSEDESEVSCLYRDGEEEPDPEEEDEWYQYALGDESGIIDDTNGEYTSMLLEEKCAERDAKRPRFEEAEEAGDENGGALSEIEAGEEEEAGREQAVDSMNLAEGVVLPSSPNLMGMPDIVLEDILRYTCKSPSEVCELEVVCKRLRRMLVGEDFWERHPIFKQERETTYCLLPLFGLGGELWGVAPEAYEYDRLLPELSDDDKEVMQKKMHRRDQLVDKIDLLSERLESGYQAVEMSTREKAFYSYFQKKVEEYQWDEDGGNEILTVLGVEDFRTLSSDILSRMMPFGSIAGEVNLRLRGDTVGYLAEVLQGYMLSKLSSALSVAMNSGDRYEVRKKDVELCARRNWRFQPLGQPLQPRPFHCDIGANEHGLESTLGCSCSLPQTSGRIWRWPEGDCHDALPADAGRRIIRRLAFKAGVVKMTHEAFILAEADLLHTMGVLLVEASESTHTKWHAAISDDISYRCSGSAVDMFQVPPPPIVVNLVKAFTSPPSSCTLNEFLAAETRYEQEGYTFSTVEGEDNVHVKSELLHTIVPGQIRSAAEKRDIHPHLVYGDTWVPTPGFTVDEEKEIEESYYRQPIDKRFEGEFAEEGWEIDAENDDEMILLREEPDSDSSEDDDDSSEGDDCSSASYHTESSVESEDYSIGSYNTY